MERITAKIQEKLYIVGELSSTLSQRDLINLLGEPHYIETDELRTPGGEEWYGGFVDGKARKIVIDFLPSYGKVSVVCNQPESCAELIAELRIKSDYFTKYDRVFDYN